MGNGYQVLCPLLYHDTNLILIFLNSHMRKHFLTVCLGIESTAPPGIRMSSRGGPPPSITVLSWSAAVDNAALNRKYNQYHFRETKI